MPFQLAITVPTDTRPANVAVSNQTFRIGAATRAGAGGKRPALTGSPVYYTISGGNSASYTCNATTGKITPATDGAATTGHTFTFTAYGTVGPGVAATITIDAPANTYSVASGNEVDAAATHHNSNLTVSRVCEMRPGITITDAVFGVGSAGVMDQQTFLNRSWGTYTFTLTSEDTSNQATIQDYQFRVQGSVGVILDHFKNTRTQTTGQYLNPIVYDNGVASTGVTIQYCDFEGPPVAALNALTGGAAWNLYDWFNNVIDADPTANPFPTAISLSASTNATIKFNTGRRLNIATTYRLEGTVTVEGNDFTQCYYDLVNFSGPASTDAGIKIIKDNHYSNCFGGRFGSASGPHPDSMQLTGGVISNVTFDGNTTSMGVYGTDSNNDYGLQGPFSSGGADAIENAVFRRMALGLQAVHGITFPNATNVIVDQCTLVENDPLNPVGPGYKPQIKLGETSSSGVIHIRDTIIASGTTPTTNGAELTIENLLMSVVTSAASAAFTGPFAPLTRAQTIAAFTPKVGGAAENIGAVTTAGAIRTGNRPPAVPAKPTLATAAASAITVTPNAAFWNGGSTVTSRDLRYSTDQTNWTVMTGVTTPQTTPSLSATTLYYVQTRDVNAVGAGAWSKSATITTT